jgi:hypothetical protein
MGIGKGRARVHPEATALSGMFPRHCARKPTDYGYARLYAFGLDDGTIKIGSTASPRERMKTHRRQHPGRIEWVHLAGGSDRGSRTEAMAQRLARQISGGTGQSEYHVGLTKQQAIQCCRAAIDYFCHAVNVTQTVI